MGDRIRVALFGLGYWGPNHARVLSEHEDLELAYICDLNPQAEKKIKRSWNTIFTTDPEKIFSDPTIKGVVIATPVSTHFPLVMRAIAAGKHILVEKPISTTLTECDAMITAAREKNCVLMVGHTYLYNPVVAQIKSILDRGYLGRILQMKFERTGPSPIREDANSLWDLAIHDLSMALYFSESLPSLVRVIGQSTHPKSDGVEDSVMMWLNTMHYPVCIEASCIGAEKVRVVRLVGDRYTLVFDDMKTEGKLLLRKTPHTGIVDNTEYSATEAAKGEPLGLQCTEFVKAMKDPSYRPLSDGDFGKRVLEIMDAAQQSLDQGGVGIRVYGGLFSNRATSVATPPRVEIWASHPPLAQEKVLTTSAGQVDLPPKIKHALDGIAPHFRRTSSIQNLHSLKISPDSVTFSLKSSPFHWHYGLNKPPVQSNYALFNKFPMRTQIATEAGILPWTGMAVCITSDNKVLIGERGKDAVTMANYVLVGSGYHDPIDVDAQGRPSLFSTVTREFISETGLSPATVRSIAQHGVSYADLMNKGFGVAYSLDLAVPFKEAQSSFMNRGNAQSVRLVPLDFTAESISAFIRDFGDGIDMHSVAALLLVGKNRFVHGGVWYQDMINNQLPKHFGRVLCIKDDQFSESKNVSEIIKSTDHDRYIKPNGVQIF